MTTRRDPRRKCECRALWACGVVGHLAEPLQQLPPVFWCSAFVRLWCVWCVCVCVCVSIKPALSLISFYLEGELE
jgi:hypothetical protein